MEWTYKISYQKCKGLLTGRTTGRKGDRLKSGLGCPVTEQSGLEGAARGQAPLLRALRGTWKLDPLSGPCGRGPRNLGHHWSYQGTWKRSGGLGRGRERTERLPVRPSWSRNFIGVSTPAWCTRTSADPYTVSVVLTCFPNSYSAGLHNPQFEKWWELKWSGEQPTKYFDIAI